jgi:hypothetical protein
MTTMSDEKFKIDNNGLETDLSPGLAAVGVS